MLRKAMLMVLITVIGFTGAFAQSKYPVKKITIIVPFAAGGGTDAVARKVADMMKKETGQDVIILNQTGGSGAVGMTSGASKTADGYTLTFVTREISWLHQMGMAKITPESFKAVALVNEDPAVLLVRADSKYNNIKELVEDARKNPGKIKFASTAKPNFYLMGLEIDQKIKFNQIPYNGAAEALPALLGGHVDATMMNPGEAIGQIKDGQLKALAVASDKRFAGIDAVPTFIENGYNVITGTWRGIAAPAKTPEHIVQNLSEIIEKITKTDEFKKFMADRNFGVRYMNSQEFQKYMQNDEINLKSIVDEIKKESGK